MIRKLRTIALTGFLILQAAFAHADLPPPSLGEEMADAAIEYRTILAGLAMSAAVAGAVIYNRRRKTSADLPSENI